MELEQLTPVPTNELEQAADMLANFRRHWERLEGDDESRHDLVRLIVERVYVEDDRVVAMTLRSNYHLILNHKANEPTEFSVDSRLFAGGSGGGWTAHVYTYGGNASSPIYPPRFAKNLFYADIISHGQQPYQASISTR